MAAWFIQLLLFLKIINNVTAVTFPLTTVTTKIESFTPSKAKLEAVTESNPYTSDIKSDYAVNDNIIQNNDVRQVDNTDFIAKETPDVVKTINSDDTTLKGTISTNIHENQVKASYDFNSFVQKNNKIGDFSNNNGKNIKEIVNSINFSQIDKVLEEIQAIKNELKNINCKFNLPISTSASSSYPFNLKSVSDKPAFESKYLSDTVNPVKSTLEYPKFNNLGLTMPMSISSSVSSLSPKSKLTESSMPVFQSPSPLPVSSAISSSLTSFSSPLLSYPSSTITSETPVHSNYCKSNSRGFKAPLVVSSFDCSKTKSSNAATDNPLSLLNSDSMYETFIMTPPTISVPISLPTVTNSFKRSLNTVGISSDKISEALNLGVFETPIPSPVLVTDSNPFADITQPTIPIITTNPESIFSSPLNSNKELNELYNAVPVTSIPELSFPNVLCPSLPQYSPSTTNIVLPISTIASPSTTTITISSSPNVDASKITNISSQDISSPSNLATDGSHTCNTPCAVPTLPIITNLPLVSPICPYIPLPYTKIPALDNSWIPKGLTMQLPTSCTTKSLNVSSSLKAQTCDKMAASSPFVLSTPDSTDCCPSSTLSNPSSSVVSFAPISVSDASNFITSSTAASSSSTSFSPTANFNYPASELTYNTPPSIASDATPFINSNSIPTTVYSGVVNDNPVTSEAPYYYLPPIIINDRNPFTPFNSPPISPELDVINDRDNLATDVPKICDTNYNFYNNDHTNQNVPIPYVVCPLKAIDKPNEVPINLSRDINPQLDPINFEQDHLVTTNLPFYDSNAITFNPLPIVYIPLLPYPLINENNIHFEAINKIKTNNIATLDTTTGNILNAGNTIMADDSNKIINNNIEITTNIVEQDYVNEYTFNNNLVTDTISSIAKSTTFDNNYISTNEDSKTDAIYSKYSVHQNTNIPPKIPTNTAQIATRIDSYNNINTLYSSPNSFPASILATNYYTKSLLPYFNVNSNAKSYTSVPCANLEKSSLFSSDISSSLSSVSPISYLSPSYAQCLSNINYLSSDNSPSATISQESAKNKDVSIKVSPMPYISSISINMMPQLQDANIDSITVVPKSNLKSSVSKKDVEKLVELYIFSEMLDGGDVDLDSVRNVARLLKTYC